jgi:hypothetical protein
MSSGDNRDVDLRDIHDIRTLKSVYCELADRCCTAAGGRAAADAIVELFVEDATLEVPAEYGGAQVGRGAIHSFWMQQSVVFSFADHLVFNERIEVSGTAARCHWKNVIPVTLQIGGTPTALWILGDYDDEYVKVGGRWRIKSVKVGIRRVFRRDDTAPF